VVDCIRTSGWAPKRWAVAVLAGAMLLAAQPVAADGCGASCRNAYNQCRIATKGSASCESAFTSCMQHCRSK
jgi:hypothetical protein